MGSLGAALYSNMGTYSHILGDERARLFKDEIERIKVNAHEGLTI